MSIFDRRIMIASLLASSAMAAPAIAQTAPATTPASDTTSDTATQTAGEYEGDIVVTAQKRDQNIQNVPISIQAIGTKRLDDLNISNFAQYTQLLPSVSFQTTQPGSTVVYMRGVASGGDGNHSGPLPSVGTYLDEQPVTTIGGTLDVHIYDIARIESLAGPQGTLYGASSEAGTIRIITNKPDFSGFYGRVDAEVNTVKAGGMGDKLEGMLNIPLAQSAALRLVGFYQRDAGYIDNVAGCRSYLPEPTPTSCTSANGGVVVDNAAFVKKNYNDTETYGGRAALKVDLDSNWTVTPTILYQEQRNHGTYGYDPKVGDLQVQHFFPEYRKDRFIQGALTIEGKLGNWDVTYAGAYLDRKTYTSSDYTDYAEAYDSMYAYAGGLAGEYFAYQDNAGRTIDPRQKIIGTDHFKKTSQELRVASPAGDRFRIVAGGFYQRQTNAIHQDYQIANLGTAVSVNGSPGTLWLTEQKRVDTDYAMFGEASYDILPNLTATAGGRAYIYDNSLIGFYGFGRNPAVDPDDGRPYTAEPFNAAGSSKTGMAGCYLANGQTLREAYLNGGDTSALLPAAVAGSPCTNLATYTTTGLIPKRTQGQGATYRFNLTFKPTDKVMLYGTVSRGFRPGGINRRGDVAPYAADFLTNYELGMKTTLFDRLRFNATIYQQAWDKFQFSFLGENSFTIIQNGPNARIRGAEADANFSTGGLSLTAAGSYTDAKTRNDLCEKPVCAVGETPLADKGTRLPITPRFKASGTARYSVPIGTAKAYIQGLVAHQSSASSDVRTIQAESLGRLKAYTTGNASIGADLSGYTFEVFVQNLWDERAQLSRFQQCGTCSQRTYIVTSTPRTIGIRAGAKF
jgi:outer membrane receptor protein involved in Fe transport